MNHSSALLFLAVLGALSLGGCLLPHGTPAPVAEYDLPRHSGNHRSNVPVRIGVVRNLSGAGRAFLLCGQGGRTVTDDSRRWLLAPETMVERELRRAFLAPEKADRRSVTVDTDIHRFDLDEGKGIFTLSLLFTVRTGNRQIPFLCEITEKAEPGKIPDAVENALVRSTAALETKIMELDPK